MSHERNSKPLILEIENGMIGGVGVDILKYFDNLNWNPPDNEPNPTNAFIPNLENQNSRPKDSGELKLKSQKLINDELVMFHSNPNLLKAITLSSMQNYKGRPARFYYVPGVEGKNPTEYPKPSALTISEQKQLYMFLLKNNLGQKFSSNDKELFQVLMQKAALEENAYQCHVKNKWACSDAQRCLHILPSVQQFMVNLWMAKKQRYLELYPTYYRPIIQNVRLAVTDQNYAVMEFKGEVWKKGFKPRLSFLSPKKRVDLLTDYDDLVRLKPIMKTVDKDSPIKPMCIEVPPVSTDVSIQQILASHSADVVMSSNSFKTLVCDSDKEPWMLPVTIKTVATADGKEKKVVFVEKKLPRNTMSKHDFNLAHAKIVTKWAYILQAHPDMYNTPTTDENSTERHLVSYDDLIASELNRIKLQQTDFMDSKKCFKEPSSFNEKPSTCTNNTSNVAGSSGSQGLRKVTEEGEIIKCGGPGPWSGLLSPEQRPKLTPRHKLWKNMLNPCLTYNFFNLHKVNEDPMLKIEEKRRLNILVRSKCDGTLAFFKSDTRFFAKVHISSKVEFQPELGASKLSRSELLREYIDLRLRPGSVLLRARSLGHTKEFMTQEVKIFEDLSRIPKLVNNNLFNPLYSVLTKLIDLPEGRYMVSHTPTAGGFADISVQSDCFVTNGVNLDTYFHTLGEVQPQLPSPEIDPTVLTSIQHRHRMPPALFNPALPVNNKKQAHPNQLILATIREKRLLGKKEARKEAKKRKKKNRQLRGKTNNKTEQKSNVPE